MGSGCQHAGSKFFSGHAPLKTMWYASNIGSKPTFVYMHIYYVSRLY